MKLISMNSCPTESKPPPGCILKAVRSERQNRGVNRRKKNSIIKWGLVGSVDRELGFFISKRSIYGDLWRFTEISAQEVTGV